MSGCTNRTVVADTGGKLWDLGNPNFVAVETYSSGTQSVLTFANGGTQIVDITFTVASAAFNAS